MRHVLAAGVLLLSRAPPARPHAEEAAWPLDLTALYLPPDLKTAYLPRPQLVSVSPVGLHRVLDLLAATVELKTLPSGEEAVVSRLAAPTLHSASSLCRQHTRIYWDQVGRSLWATLMFDATGKIPDGILAGNYNMLGAWDECLNIRVALKQSDHPLLPADGLNFTGRYVPVYVTLNLLSAAGDRGSIDTLAAGEPDGGNDDFGGAIIMPRLGMPLTIAGTCVPSSCSSEDVRSGLQTMLGDNFTVFADKSTVKGESAELNSADKFVISLMGIVGALMVIGTAADLWHRGFGLDVWSEVKTKSDSPVLLLGSVSARTPSPSAQRSRDRPVLGAKLRALIAFSVYTNAKKLLDTTASENTLTCLHGIRFISMTWVALGHAASLALAMDKNMVLAFDWLRRPPFSAIANATPSVDTFFLLSGVLLAYGFCAIYAKTGKLSLAKFYLHRYLRLTPAMAFMIGIAATWFTYVGDGPRWNADNATFKENCQTYWWRNLLYIQSFFAVDRMCLAQTWFLADDMQMFILSPLVLLPLVWRPMFGMMWLGVLIAGFLALRVAVWSTRDLPPTLLMVHGDDIESFMAQYMASWNRCTVWLLGIGVGYLLYRLRGKQVVLKPWLCLLGWISAFAIGISVVYGMTAYQMPWQTVPKAVAVAYGGLHRLAWAVAVAWVIFACVTGYGGWINAFLSYPGFVPLSRLTYAAYLVHYNILLFGMYSSKDALYFDVVRLVYWFVPQVIVTFAVSFAFSMAFEAPFMVLEKILFAPPSPQERRPDGVINGKTDDIREVTMEKI